MNDPRTILNIADLKHPVKKFFEDLPVAKRGVYEKMRICQLIINHLENKKEQPK